jgi:anti-sigma factor RsiW
MRMSTCKDLEPLFASYVEGGAAADDRAAIDAHLERCPPCQERLSGERAARELLVARRSGLRSCASAALRAKCAAHRSEGAQPALAPPDARVRRTWVPLSLAATLLLGAVGIFMFGLTGKVEALAAQLTLDHVKCFQLNPRRDGPVDSAAAGLEWTKAEGWPLQVPSSSSGAELQLLGVRRCFTSSGRVAHMLYTWRGEPLSVFVLPGTIGSVGQSDTVLEKFGHDAIVWSGGGRTYVVLARGRPADLERVLRHVKANAR